MDYTEGDLTPFYVGVSMVICCPQCTSASKLLFQTTDINRRTTHESFSYYRCTQCELIFLNPIPHELARYYAGDYYQIPRDREMLAVRASAQRHKLTTVQRFRPSGKLLEIGPGYGDFAFLAQQVGFDVDVIEMDLACCAFIQTMLNIHTINSDAPHMALRNLGQYDVIAMWQVIEHLTSPWELLDSLAVHLNPGGIVVIATPNPAAIQFRLFGSRWVHLDAPRHLQLIPADVLSKRLGTSGLRIQHLTAADRESRKANNFGWKVDLMNLIGVSLKGAGTDTPRLNDTGEPRRSWKYQLARKGLRSVAAALELAFSPLEQTGMRGCSYTAVYRK